MPGEIVEPCPFEHLVYRLKNGPRVGAFIVLQEVIHKPLQDGGVAIFMSHKENNIILQFD